MTTKIATLLSAILFAVSPSVFAYDWVVSRVIDGDTFQTTQKFYPEELGYVKIRLKGIDTPEKGSTANCQKEVDLAIEATRYLNNHTPPGTYVNITEVTPDKYSGRIVAKASYTVNGVQKDLSTLMLESGYAVVYDPKNRKDWCN